MGKQGPDHPTPPHTPKTPIFVTMFWRCLASRTLPSCPAQSVSSGRCKKDQVQIRNHSSHLKCAKTQHFSRAIVPNLPKREVKSAFRAFRSDQLLQFCLQSCVWHWAECVFSYCVFINLERSLGKSFAFSHIPTCWLNLCFVCSECVRNGYLCLNMSGHSHPDIPISQCTNIQLNWNIGIL